MGAYLVPNSSASCAAARRGWPGAARTLRLGRERDQVDVVAVDRAELARLTAGACEVEPSRRRAVQPGRRERADARAGVGLPRLLLPGLHDVGQRRAGRAPGAHDGDARVRALPQRLDLGIRPARGQAGLVLEPGRGGDVEPLAAGVAAAGCQHRGGDRRDDDLPSARSDPCPARAARAARCAAAATGRRGPTRSRRPSA